MSTGGRLVSLYDMELHEEISIDNLTSCVRVPSGWVYKFWTENNIGRWLPRVLFVPDSVFQHPNGDKLYHSRTIE